MAMAEKFNTGQEICLQIPSAASAASKSLRCLSKAKPRRL